MKTQQNAISISLLILNLDGLDWKKSYIIVIFMINKIISIYFKFNSYNQTS
jgi:hypothetical protein